MGTLTIVVLLPVGLLLAYFWMRFRRGQVVARHMRLFADAFDHTLAASGSKSDALSAALDVFATCPKLRELTTEEKVTVVKVFAGVPDPKWVILDMLVRLTADNALKALRNDALLRDLAGVYLRKRG